MSNRNAKKSSYRTNAEVLLDLVSINKLRRVLIHAGIMLAVLAVQDLICPHLKIAGTKPLIAPVFAVAAGLFGGGVWGGFFGLACGLACDMIFSENTVAFAVFFPVIGFTSGLLINFFMCRRFISFLFICLCALALTAAVQAVPLWLSHGSNVRDLARTAGLQALLSLPAAPLVYFPFRAVEKKDS